jgi:hypothetical protein
MKITINPKKFPQAVKLLLFNLGFFAFIALILWPTKYMSMGMALIYGGGIFAIFCLISCMLELKS